MKNLELPTKFLLAMADIAGFKKAFDQRVNETIPAVYQFKAISKALSRKLSAEEEKKISDFEARARRLRRTKKGLDDVMAHLMDRVDRMQQSVEEIGRVREEWRLLLNEFDDALLSIARGTKIKQT